MKEELLDHYNSKIKEIVIMLRNLQNNLAVLKNELLEKLNTDILMMGPNATQLKCSLEKMNVHPEAYFGGEVELVGNMRHKILVDFREGNNSLLTFLEGKEEKHKRHLKIWNIIVNIDSFFSTPSPTQKQAKNGAQLCESFGEFYPVYFPKNNLTRKMHSLSYVFPRFIREQNICYKMLKLEQEGERLHHVLNEIERRYENIKKRPLRYFYMLLEYKNFKNVTWLFSDQKKETKQEERKKERML